MWSDTKFFVVNIFFVLVFDFVKLKSNSKVGTDILRNTVKLQFKLIVTIERIKYNEIIDFEDKVYKAYTSM